MLEGHGQYVFAYDEIYQNSRLCDLVLSTQKLSYLHKGEPTELNEKSLTLSCQTLDAPPLRLPGSLGQVT
jgi:hypothetical protein